MRLVRELLRPGRAELGFPGVPLPPMPSVGSVWRERRGGALVRVEHAWPTYVLCLSLDEPEPLACSRRRGYGIRDWAAAHEPAGLAERLRVQAEAALIAAIYASWARKARRCARRNAA